MGFLFLFFVCVPSVGAFTAFGRSLTFVFDYYCYYETANQPSNIVCVVVVCRVVCLLSPAFTLCCVVIILGDSSIKCLTTNQTGQPASHPLLSSSVLCALLLLLPATRLSKFRLPLPYTRNYKSNRQQQQQ